MRPETLPLVSDFKKEYKFLWYISANGVTVDGTVNALVNGQAAQLKASIDIRKQMKRLNVDGMQLYTAVVANPLFSGYISQLAEQVNIPDDEFDTETIPQGPVDYQMPKRVKLEDIIVTYLEDSLETVYNFHKAWFQAIRCSKGIGINSPSLFSASAKYIPFENTMLASEYILIKNRLSQMLNSAVTSNFAMPTLPIGVKATSMTTYPSIYPKKIHRTAANHSGTDIAKVEVTYARIANFEKKHSPLQTWNGLTNTWENVSSFF